MADGDVMDERDRAALAQIGNVDLNKLPDTGAEVSRETDIHEALDYLEDFADGDKLSNWEYDFYESIQNFLVRGYRLSDKQFEKLLQVKLKYE